MRYLFGVLIVIFIFGCSNQHNNNAANKHSRQLNNEIQETKYSRLLTNKDNNQKVILDVPIIKQNPELKYGCEVTSLAMLLQYAGIQMDKMELARKIQDDEPVIKDKNGNIIKWGDPNDGFVGDVTGKNAGYAVYVKPTERLMRTYLPGTINLTNKPFDRLMNQVRHSKPVLVWATGDFKSPDRWETWRHHSKTIKTPLDLHAVVLVGFDEDNVYVNDPLAGKKANKINKARFKTAWNALGRQALSYQ